MKVSGIVIASLVAAGVARADVIPSLLTPRDVNTLIALEAAGNDLLTSMYGVGFAQQQMLGDWTGTITDGGWNLSFTGTLNGTLLTIHQTGTLNLAGGVASWTDFGLFGSSSIGGFGTFHLDPIWEQIFFDTPVDATQDLFASIIGLGVIGNMVSGASIAGDDWLEDQSLTTFGAAAFAANAGLENRSQQAQAGSMTLLQGTFTAMHTPSGLVPAGTVLRQEGTQDPITGATTFRSQVVSTPESGTWSLVAMALLAIAASAARRRRSRAAFAIR